MKNKYGNYVLLKLLSTLDNEGKHQLIQNVSKNLNQVNVAKYKGRWAQFIDDNPLKIQGVTTTGQSTRPSLFKSASMVDTSNPNKDFYELNSPTSAELWKEANKKKVNKDKEEKSQFYYESGKSTIQRMNSGNWSGEEVDAYEGSEMSRSQGRPGDNQNVGSGGKRGKNANMKFYTDKGQHHMNKAGHGTFY